MQTETRTAPPVTAASGRIRRGTAAQLLREGVHFLSSY